MKLIIEKLDNGYLVNGWVEPGERFNGQSAFTTLAEVIAFIRSRMEPEAMEVKWDKPDSPDAWKPEGEGEFEEGPLVRFTQNQPSAIGGEEKEIASHASHADALRRLISPTQEELDETTRTVLSRHMKRLNGDKLKEAWDFFCKPKPIVGNKGEDIIHLPTDGIWAAPEQPLDKLQRLGQKFDATPTDPPWKRAKVGDWVTYRNEITGKTFNAPVISIGTLTLRVRRSGAGGDEFIRFEDIIGVFPHPAPRHGDFGSRPEEDGA